VAGSRSPSALLPLSADTLFILLALADGPRHGYGIIGDVDARSHGTVLLQTGALYRTLRRLLQDGVIGECPPPATADSDDPRRRYYQLTAFGRRVRDAEIDRMARIVQAARAAGKRPRLA
jgi:DNA-binding PadR family transcriptional regulator